MNLRPKKSQSYYGEDVLNDETANQEDIPNGKMAKSSSKIIDRSEFLKLIKEHPVLYDVNHPKFNQYDSTTMVWSQISAQIGISGLFFFVSNISNFIDYFLFSFRTSE